MVANRPKQTSGDVQMTREMSLLAVTGLRLSTNRPIADGWRLRWRPLDTSSRRLVQDRLPGRPMVRVMSLRQRVPKFSLPPIAGPMVRS
jgi:hypothetical protein